MKEIKIFGDSHIDIILKTNNKKYNFIPYRYIASSAMGLNNDNSVSKYKHKFEDDLKTLSREDIIVFKFGQVDIDFVYYIKLVDNTDLKFEDFAENSLNKYFNVIKKFVNGDINPNNFYLMTPFPTRVPDEELIPQLCRPHFMKYRNFREVFTEKLSKVELPDLKTRTNYGKYYSDLLIKKANENNIKTINVFDCCLDSNGLCKLPDGREGNHLGKRHVPFIRPELDKIFCRNTKKNNHYNIMSNFVKHIELCLENADKYESKITKEILEMDGMSGKKTRHFYNNICSMNGARYLEIGTWKGSSICSAMCGNKMTCLAIDNWSQFRGPKHEFMRNFEKYKGDNNATFIEKNCWDIDANEIGKFNIYMYDGNHTETSHYQAINHYLGCLDDVFIYLVDDWNWEDVRNGTMNSIKQNNLEIVYQKEIRTTFDNTHPKVCRKNSDWHNGISIFVLKK